LQDKGFATVKLRQGLPLEQQEQRQLVEEVT